MDDEVVGGSVDLREYLHVLSRRRWVVASVTVLVVGLALAYSFAEKPVYTATASVLVPQEQAASALNLQNSQLPAAPSLQRSLADEQQFAKGDAVKHLVTQRLGFRADIGVGSSATADVLTFSASSGQRARAAEIANAYAKAYIDARRLNQVSQYAQQVTALETSISKLQAQISSLPPGDVQRTALQNSVVALTQTVNQTQAATQLSSETGPSIVDAAKQPTSPSSPKPLRNGLLGLLAGLLLGVGLAFLVDRFDDGVNSLAMAERISDGPVIGLIPLVDSWKAKESHHLALIEDPTSRVAEAYRTLRTGVQFLSVDEPKRVIGITSSVPGEGKTTTVANLAVSFARAGRQVTVVSCDLRRPRIHEFFGVSNELGLTSTLLGELPLAEISFAVPNEPGLKLIPSGPVPPNPAEILSLDRVRQFVEQVAHDSDLVLLDCPPVLPVTDSLLLSRLVDGLIVVTAAKSTSVRELQRTLALLRQVEAPVLGSILNRVPTEGRAAYSYGYGYGYYGTYSDEDQLPRRVTNGAAEVAQRRMATTGNRPSPTDSARSSYRESP